MIGDAEHLICYPTQYVKPPSYGEYVDLIYENELIYPSSTDAGPWSGP
jgi:hypothetical protein